MSLIEVNYINYLDRINGTYKKILTVNILPKNAVFKSIIKYMNVPRLSPFEPHSSSNRIPEPFLGTYRTGDCNN